MNSLRQYISSVPKLQKIVLGNSSADMDSVVGSIALSWYYGQIRNLGPFSPVVNCPRSEFKFRIEIVQHLKNFGLDLQNLTFRDELGDLS